MDDRYENKIQQLVLFYPQLKNKPWFHRIIHNRIMVGGMNDYLAQLHLAHVKANHT
jgi:hypothetical protein